jgi:hypothetical protein
LLSNTYVLGTNGNLWLETPNYQTRTLIDGNVKSFSPAANGDVWVLGTNGNLWLETPNYQTRTLMDGNVLAFAPVGNGDAFVEGTNHNLWLEAPGWQATNRRTLMDGNVLAFAPVGNGDAYVEGTDSKLWLEAPGWQATNSRSLIDANVYAFAAAGNGKVYVQGYNGNLWLEHPNYPNRTQIDANVLAFAPAGNGDVYVEGTDTKLWLETPNYQDRTLVDANVLAFAPDGNWNILVEGTDTRLWLETPNYLNRTQIDANVLAMAPANANPIGLGFAEVGTYVGPKPIAATKGNWSWSGYVAETNVSQPQANSVTAVSGSWVVPTVTGRSTGAFDSSDWVGIDGYGNWTVEQIGTEERFVNGKASYCAWWEMYSSGALQPEQVIASMTVNPGDLISGSVQYITSGIHAGQFYLSIVDKSRANDSFSTYQTSSNTQSPLAQRSFAEWIEEAPIVNGSIATVPNFGAVYFSDATAVINGVFGAINCPSWQSQAVNIASGGVTYDTTSALNDLGSSFVVTYNTSAGAAAVTGTKAASREPLGTTAGASGPLARKVEGPALIDSAALGAGYASSGTIHITMYRPGGRVADGETAAPSKLPPSWFDFDALDDGDGDALHEGRTSRDHQEASLDRLRH